jgi:hypothetical protein
LILGLHDREALSNSQQFGALFETMVITDVTGLDKDSFAGI